MAELFDDITRVFGSGLPRRRMLQLLAGVFAGGALPALWPARAAAADQVPCANPFSTPLDTPAHVDCTGCTQARMDNLCQTTCNAAKPQVIAKAQLLCPTTCPDLVEVTWGCSGYIDDQGDLWCTTTATGNCRCATAGDGEKCCGLGKYCKKGTETCCGTTCVPFGQRCPINVSPSR